MDSTLLPRAPGGLTGVYRPSIWLGFVVTTFGSGLLQLLQPETSVPAWIFLNVPVGIGTGILFPAMAFAIQAAREPVLNGQAATFYSFVRTFGRSVGVAVSGVVFRNTFGSKLETLPAFAEVAFEYIRDATAVVGIIQRMAGGRERDELVIAFNEALHVIWISLVAFSALGLLISVAIKGYSLNQDHVTKQALVKSQQSQSGNEVGEAVKSVF